MTESPVSQPPQSGAERVLNRVSTSEKIRFLLRTVPERTRGFPPALRRLYQILAEVLSYCLERSAEAEQIARVFAAAHYLIERAGGGDVPPVGLIEEVQGLISSEKVGRTAVILKLKRELRLASEPFLNVSPIPTAVEGPRRQVRRSSVDGAPRQIEDVDGYGFKPDPLTAHTVAELIDRMRQFRIWAGDLALRELARRSNGAFAVSTLSKALNNSRLPSLGLVQSFVRACGGSENDVQRWVTAWRQVRMPSQACRQAEALPSVAALPRSRSAS